jgi:hypothetical protein
VSLFAHCYAFSKYFPYLYTHRSARHTKCEEDYPWVLLETMGESPGELPT